MTAYGSQDFHQVYGMTEMGPAGTSLSPAEQVTKAGSIGCRGMPGVDLRVVRPDGADAGSGGTGEIWLRSESRMVGYLDDEAATAEVFAGDWYRSGDLGRVDEDGFVTIVDRMKDVIITGGENVASQEVEGALRGHPDVLDVAVVGRPHPQWGETVVAVVVRREGADLDVAGMRAWLEPRIARYKVPRELVLRRELPRTPSGKITKHVLRAQLAESAEPAAGGERLSVHVPWVRTHHGSRPVKVSACRRNRWSGHVGVRGGLARNTSPEPYWTPSSTWWRRAVWPHSRWTPSRPAPSVSKLLPCTGAGPPSRTWSSLPRSRGSGR